MIKRLLNRFTSIFQRPVLEIHIGRRVAVKTLTTYETGTTKTMCITGRIKDYFIADAEAFCLELVECTYSATYTGNNINQTMTSIEASSLKIDPSTITSLDYLD